jgi:proton-coupled amino acid transporter
MLHLRARAKTRTQKALDVGLIIFGVITTTYTTIQTIRVLLGPAEAPQGPPVGACQ